MKNSLKIYLCIALLISGCATGLSDSHVNVMPPGAAYSSGWVGVEVAYRFKGLTASHTITSVAEGSPASAAGIKAGDEVIYIGRDNAGYMNTAEVARRLSESAPNLVLVVKRKGHKDFLSFTVSKADTRLAQRPAPPKSPAAGVSPGREQMPPKDALDGVQDSDIPPYATTWGFKGKYTTDNGILLTQITPRSPAEEAGLKTGDVIIALNSAVLKGASDFDRPPYVPVKLLVRREGAETEKIILPEGIVKLKVYDLDQRFLIPGVPEPETPKAVSAIEVLDFINVLDRVVLDPQSGRVAVIGHYDQAYNTGNIPYLDLLKTAMANPAPILNLHETPETKKAMIESGNKVASDLPRMVDAVRGHPDFERERQLLIREMAKGYGLTPQEYADWYNYVKLVDKKEVFPPKHIREIQRRVFSNLGYPEVAQALELLPENTSEAAAKALQILGRDAEAQAVMDKYRADSGRMHDELMVAACLAIPQSADIVTAKELEPLREWYVNKKVSWEVIVKNVQNLLMPYTPKNGDKIRSNLMTLAFTRIFLSPKSVQFLEGLPTPYVYIEPIDLDGHSQLARIMYEADYALKSLSVMPELFQHIPGSLSRMEYQNKHGMFFEGSTIHYHQWLEPRMVGMEISPDHRVVRFTSSHMRYLFADNSRYWKAPPNEKLERGFADWCGHFMDHYDTYAGVLPAFHKLREAAKVLALAKLLIAGNIPIDLKAVTQEKWDTPEKVEAYWVLSQGIYTNGKHATIRAFEGGVSFKTRQNWTQMTPSATTTTEASAQLSLSASIGQQAVKAATAGNLEQARHLAELSAQAMTGRLSKADLATLNLAVPKPGPVSVSATAVELQKEMIKKTHQQIVSLAQSPSSKETAGSVLAQLNVLYDQVKERPQAAGDYLLQLRTATPRVVAGGKPRAEEKTAGESAAQIEQMEYEKSYGLWVQKQRQLIEERLRTPNPYIDPIYRTLKTTAPPALPPRKYDQLQPGDVILFTHEGITDVSFWINLGDRLTTNVKSPVSHSVLYLKKVNGKKLFLDHTSERGSHIISEAEFLRTYGQRDGLVASSAVAVAQPVSESETARIWEAAKEMARKEAGLNQSRSENLFDRSGYGLYGNDDMVCSEASRFVLVKSGRDIPESFSPLKRLLGIHYGPANFFSDDYNFIITPLYAVQEN